MTKINYKSDFDFILKLKDCADPKKTVPFPDGNFDARFWTSSKANAYTDYLAYIEQCKARAIENLTNREETE